MYSRENTWYQFRCSLIPPCHIWTATSGFPTTSLLFARTARPSVYSARAVLLNNATYVVLYLRLRLWQAEVREPSWLKMMLEVNLMGCELQSLVWKSKQLNLHIFTIHLPKGQTASCLPRTIDVSVIPRMLFLPWKTSLPHIYSEVIWLNREAWIQHTTLPHLFTPTCFVSRQALKQRLRLQAEFSTGPHLIHETEFQLNWLHPTGWWTAIWIGIREGRGGI